MSSAQGPREAGMQASANAAGRRRHGVLVLFDLTEAAGMSSAQGPREAGMQASANAAGRRQRAFRCDDVLSEAEA